MKRAIFFSLVLVSALFVASPFAAAQDQPASSTGGQVTVGLLDHSNVTSSKFQEYRDVPRGVSLPFVNLFGSKGESNFSLLAQSVRQTDQRYTGWANTSWFGVSFDYNQIPHNMGNDGHSIMTETAPGVWSMDATLRQALQTAVENRLPAATRTWDFYSALYAPTIAAANRIDLTDLRERGNIEFDLGKNLPFDLKLTYMREVKKGTRGPGGGYVRGFVDNIVEIPEPMNEVTQDLGFRAALNRTWGNVHAAFSRNWYNDRQETTIVDNPLRAFDQVYTAASGSIPALGGGAQARFINPPDNAANTGSFGVLLKFARQTRIGADVTMGQWTQNAQIYPYTINTTVLTGTGERADSLSALQVQTLDGKINTTTLNFSFSSRPINGLGLRMRYRSYDLANKTPAFQRVGYVSMDRAWSAATYTTYPLGFPTADPYGSKTGRFDVSASYDVRALTLEAAYRHTQIDRTYREATTGSESGVSISAILHAQDWMGFRGMFDKGTRKASGYDPAASIGLQADESERDSTRAGIDLELTPSGKVAFVLAYFRRNDEYPNRPDRVAGVSDTPNGLLKATYDTYTAEVDLTPSERVELSVYYTYEKNLSTTQTGSSLVTNILTFEGSDKTNTLGVNASVQLVPEKWTFKVNARHQKLNGLMDITGDPAGSFSLARATLGGIQDITDYGDTQLTMALAQIEYAVAKAWSLGIGYVYEKYNYADAFSAGLLVYPQAGTGFYLKADDRAYKANVAFAKLNYRF